VGLGRGRFSLWSAVGLTVVGYRNKNFEELFAGANEMDEHFKTADFETIICLYWLY
jgi:glucose-6-phosphate isomerase